MSEPVDNASAEASAASKQSPAKSGKKEKKDRKADADASKGAAAAAEARPEAVKPAKQKKAKGAAADAPKGAAEEESKESKLAADAEDEAEAEVDEGDEDGEGDDLTSDEGDAGDEGDDEDPADTLDKLFDARDKDKQDKELKAAPPGSAAAPKAKSWCSCSFATFALLVLGSLVVLFVLQLHAEEYEADGVQMSIPDVDYYTVLGVSRDASLTEIKKAYRTLAMRLHPDKNPNCADCQARMVQVSQAADVLMDAEKRRLYDRIETSFEPLSSTAVTLTSENFDELVTRSDDFWLIQIYVDWDKGCIRFAPSWEEAKISIGSHVKFGRIHLKREAELVKRLPVRFGVVPTVAAFANGQFVRSKTFGAFHVREALESLIAFADETFPNPVRALPPTFEGVTEFLRETIGGDVTVPSPLSVVVFSRKRQPSVLHGAPRSHSARGRSAGSALDPEPVVHTPLALKALARRFGSAVRFAELDQSALKDDAAARAVAEKLSKALPTGAPSKLSLPAVLIQMPSGLGPGSQPQWASGVGTFDKLAAYLSKTVKQAVLPLDSLALHKSCLRAPSSGSGDRDGDSDDESSSGGGGGDTWNCVVRLSCPVPAAGSEKQQKQRETGASQLTKSLLDMLARSSSTGSAAAWAGAQFGVADARQDEALLPLCRLLGADQDTALIAFRKQGSEAGQLRDPAKPAAVKFERTPEVTPALQPPEETLQIGPLRVSTRHATLAATLVVMALTSLLLRAVCTPPIVKGVMSAIVFAFVVKEFVPGTKLLKFLTKT